MKDKWPRSWGYIKWLYPNLKIKRWFMLAVGGIFLFATGFAVMNDGVALGYLELQFREIVYRITGNTARVAIPVGFFISTIGVIAIFLGLRNAAVDDYCAQRISKGGL